MKNMRRVAFLGALAATLASPPGWASESSKQPLDPAREHALNAAVDQLAQEALAGVAPQLVEVERPTFVGMMDPRSIMSGLTFATKARSTGDPDLCKATRVWVQHQGGRGDELISTSTVYKVVGDLKPLPDMWNDAYSAELSAKCAHAGRVIPTRTSGFGEERFFEAKIDEEVRVWFPARALELALERAHAHPDEVACEGGGLEDQQQCRAELRTPKTLTLNRLLAVKMEHCDKSRAGCYVVTGTFLRSGFRNVQNAWVLSLRADIPDTNASDAVKGVAGLVVTPSIKIFD